MSEPDHPDHRPRRGVTHDDLWSMKRIEAPTLSRDGRLVAFVLRDPEVAGGTFGLWLLDPALEGSARCLLTGPEPKSGLAWSPDGSRLAFSMRPAGEEAPQVHLISIADAAVRRLTYLPQGATTPRWRPDGRALLFESMCASPGYRSGARIPGPRVYVTTPVRWWTRWLDSRRPHPFVIELDGQDSVRDLLANSAFAVSEGFRGVLVALPHTTMETLQAQWSPGGASIVFAAYADVHNLVRSRTGPAVYNLNISGGEPIRLTPVGRSFTDPIHSHDGASLYAFERHWPDGYAQTDIVRLYDSSSPPYRMTEGWDRSLSSLALACHDEYLYLNAEDAGTQRVFEVHRNGGPVTGVSDASEGTLRAFAADPDRVLALHESTTRPPEIVAIPMGSRSRVRLTAFNDRRSARIDAPVPRHFWFRSEHGASIHNLLFLPPRFNPDRKYPLITCIHGGPHVIAADAFYENWLNPHLLARPGYVVLCTNYSGSSGFGRNFTESIESDVLRLPAGEILQAARFAAEEFAFIDPARQAAVGGSYGGYLINWLLGQTAQFKCAVVHAGAVSNLSQYGASDCGFDREVRMTSPVWEATGQWLEQNPLMGAGRFATPTLLTHGELDYRVPITESLTTFKLLQRLGIDSRLVVFPDEGHFIANRTNSRVLWREIWHWLRAYL